MVMTVNVNTLGLENMLAKIDGFSQRRMNAAIATALTRSARDARDEIKGMMPKVFDRPTPYALRGVFFRNANAQNLEANVWFNRDWGTGVPQNRFLAPQVYGGGRNQKRFEKALQAKGSMPAGMFAVPTRNTKRDAYGGIDAGQLKQIISQTGTELLSGYTNSISQDKLKRQRAFGRAGGQFFAVPTQRGKLAPGIYLAEGAKVGRGKYQRSGSIKAILLFKSSVHYTERLPFYETANAVASKAFNTYLTEAITASLARLQARQSR